MRIKTKIYLVLISFFYLTNQMIGQTNQEIVKDSTDASIIDVIWNLKEVQERNEYVIKNSNGKRRLVVFIYKKPKKNENEYYWIKVVEDNGTTLYTHYNFFVYPQDMRVTYFDTSNNKEIELIKQILEKANVLTI